MIHENLKRIRMRTKEYPVYTNLGVHGLYANTTTRQKEAFLHQLPESCRPKNKNYQYPFQIVSLSDRFEQHRQKEDAAPQTQKF